MELLYTDICHAVTKSSVAQHNSTDQHGQDQFSLSGAASQNDANSNVLQRTEIGMTNQGINFPHFLPVLLAPAISSHDPHKRTQVRAPHYFPNRSDRFRVTHP